MGVGSPALGRPLSRLSGTRRKGGSPPEEDHLPLFDDLRAASKTNMLYPFSTPNEIEQSLAAADSAFKPLPSFNLSVQMMKSCDFLKNDCEKTDSNWLVTPPDSPLFPSLEFDQPGRFNILLKRKSRPANSPLSRVSKITVERTYSSQGKGIVTIKLGSHSEKQQESKRKWEAQGKRNNKENQKERINDNSLVKPHGKRQKSTKATAWRHPVPK